MSKRKWHEAIEFEAFPKIPRLNREIIVTEKLDGTNAQVIITEDGEIAAGSRKRLITPEDDNFGFARWVAEHADELRELGPGRHFGEWWGSGIQRGYGLAKGERRFSLFNTSRWTNDNTPDCVSVVPILGSDDTLASDLVADALGVLARDGSYAAPGFMDPEGVVIFHPASNHVYKATIKGDEVPKALAA